MGGGGSPASPLKGLLNVVDVNSAMLSPDPSASNLVASAADRAQILLLSRTFGEDKGAVRKPGAKVVAHFAPIHELLAGTAGHAGLDEVLASATPTPDQIRSVGTGLGATN